MPTKLEETKLKNLLWGSLIIILLVGAICYNYLKKHFQEKENKEFTISEFINGTTGTPPMKNILVGMVFGIVFGFIDNAGMFFGMDALEPFLPTEGFVAAGIGNTYSSVLGAFLASFLSNVIKINTGVEKVPVWSDAAGIVVGAVLGIYIPPMIVKLF
tara:strand:+ start:1602 stop:2075 length:474 start_codon:yes stop_codon:yes gene_type:complete